MRRFYTDLFESRENFWTIIRDAYSKFRSLNENAPKNLEALLGAAGEPPDLYPRKERDLLQWPIENKPLNANQRLLLEFVSKIYPPDHEQGKLIDSSSFKTFHKARGALSHFWQDWIHAVGLSWTNKTYRSEKNQLVLLAWLEIALAKNTHASGEGKHRLFEFVHKLTK
jgi:hypothetical protein